MEATVTKSILYFHDFHVFIRMKPYVDGALKDVEKDPPLLLSVQGEAKDRVGSSCVQHTQPMNMEVKVIIF